MALSVFVERARRLMTHTHLASPGIGIAADWSVHVALVHRSGESTPPPPPLPSPPPTPLFAAEFLCCCGVDRSLRSA